MIQGRNAGDETSFSSANGQEALTLNSSGSLAAITGGIKIVNGSLTLDNTATNLVNRVADNQAITLDQGIFQFTSNTTTASTETVGTLVSDAGLNQFRAPTWSSTRPLRSTMAGLTTK